MNELIIAGKAAAVTISCQQVIIDSEFQALIPPLSSEERQQLEANILADGCRDPLVVWGETLIDGHNRYEICTRLGLPFDTVEMDFESRGHAIEWIIKNQFGRRNLIAYVRTQLALRLESVFENRAKANQIRKPVNSVPNNYWEQNAAESLRQEIEAIKKQGLPRNVAIDLIDVAEAKTGKEIRRKNMRDSKGVYIAKSGKSIKIGIAVDPETRIDQLKVGNPDIYLVEFFEYGDKSQKIESLAHAKFNEYRVHGEWFSEEIEDRARNYMAREYARLSETSSQLAAVAGVSIGTIAKVKKIEAVATPEVKAALAAGNVSINQIHTQIVRAEKEEKREERREENRAKIAEFEAPAGIVESSAKFATIVIDPPWDWGDEGDQDQLGRARPDYSTMSMAQLLDLPVGNLADDDCHIYLWITNRSLPKGFALLEKWGFRYITALTWVKPHFGMGNYFRGQTEQVLFGVKGSQPLKRKDVGTVFNAPRGTGGHSSKPEAFLELVESCSPGPYVEMFSRAGRADWTTWGENGYEGA